MLLLNTIKLILIALNILPYRITHRKILFMIYLGTLVCNGEFYRFFTLIILYITLLSLFKGFQIGSDNILVCLYCLQLVPAETILEALMLHFMQSHIFRRMVSMMLVIFYQDKYYKLSLIKFIITKNEIFLFIETIKYTYIILYTQLLKT